ncbi:MAG: prepilin-type N-terminal cleavage/methylation domain-containing protein [Candidatus Acidiferrum sp.]
MNNQRGFSLIELLIVVAIILIISAIAIPNYMRSRMQANEASAVSSLRMINTAAITYFSTYQSIGYPPTLASMGGAAPCLSNSSSACMLDDTIAQGTKSGYIFIWNGDGAIPSVAYAATATPVSAGSSGQRMFCTDQTGLTRYEISGSGCNGSSTPVP